MHERRVVVTGTGAISPLGCSVKESWTGLLAGKSGIARVTHFPVEEYRCQIAGEVKNFNILDYLTPKEASRQDKFCHFAVAAAAEAIAQAGLENTANYDPWRCGVLVSSGIGGIETTCRESKILEERGPRRVSPLTIPMMIADMASGVLSIRYNFRGPNFGIVSACASSAHSIGESSWIIKRGDADIMLTGGTECGIVPLSMAGFSQMRALSSRNDDPEHASRPFDAERDGFVPAEGAGVLVLEELEHALARGAKPLAEIIGYGASGDASHITAPRADGSGAAAAIRSALGHAGIAVEEVDYVNAHGTSTPMNDLVETKCLKLVFGDYAPKLAISSTKSMTGHMLGASGGFESIVCVQSLLEDRVPGTMNLEHADPECDLNYIANSSCDMPVGVALNISLGFGGHNAAILFKKYE